MELRKDAVLDEFVRRGAMLEGHFLLSSGLHSDRYLQCALMLQYPDIAEQLAMLLFQELAREPRLIDRVTAVVSPAIGGIVFGQEVARVLRTMTRRDVRALFTERDDSGTMLLRRGFALNDDDAVLIVEDVVTTGKSTREVMAVATAAGASVIGVGCVIDRSGGETQFEVPFAAVAAVSVRTWEPAACPLCAQGVPCVKPGSRKQPR